MADGSQTSVADLRQVLAGRVRPPSALDPTVPADLEAFVLLLMNKAPADRFPDMQAALAQAGELSWHELGRGPDDETGDVIARPEAWGDVVIARKEIKAEYLAFAAKVGITDIQFIPLSALNGDMIVDRGDSLDWYDGPTLLEILESAPAAHTEHDEPFRFPVQFIVRAEGNFRGYAGTVVSGSIARGDKVVIWFSSADYDDRQFTDPYRFDITRWPNDHVAFNLRSPHLCLGAQLARMELKLLFEELLPRVRRVELDGPVERLRSNFICGIKRLPVRFDWV